MSTQGSSENTSELPDGKGLRIGIVSAQWHTHVVDVLESSAVETLKACGLTDNNITALHCPGSYELPVVVGVMARSGMYDAVIALGVVVRGETAHFEYVSSPVAHGLQQIAVETGIPCLFGVLTTETLTQAEERAGGIHGNKGAESAIAAIQTCHTIKTIGSSTR